MIAFNKSTSKPFPVPSLSIEVINNSPAPFSVTSCAHSIASIPVSFRPPWVYTVHPSLFFFASIATTMHWEPNLLAPSSISIGLLIALVFIPTLSAPANKRFLISSKLLTPPPTVKGIKH